MLKFIEPPTNDPPIQSPFGKHFPLDSHPAPTLRDGTSFICARATRESKSAITTTKSAEKNHSHLKKSLLEIPITVASQQFSKSHPKGYMSSDNKRRHVFISHHHADDAEVTNLTGLLAKKNYDIRNSSIRAKPANQQRLERD